ncbi:MAG TPA: hypothetical protein EYP35_10100 [Desulfobacterales bacterium]|nr:hypothetical protein [Desulfobacterales bacterium]HIP37905.1 hypothetical protein [Desulfocapsa sulfexigens]
MLKDEKKGVDLFSTIHTADKVDPFDGLDLNEICVSPNKLNPASATDKKKSNKAELFDLNPLDGIDMQDLSINPDTLTSAQTSDGTTLKHQNNVNFVILPGKDSPDAEEKPFTRTIRSLSTDISHPPVIQPHAVIKPIVEKAYHYAELTQIREKIFSSLEKSDGNSLLVASPDDNTGTTLLAASLGYNTACSCQKSVLLVDCNMRRPGLHDFFCLPQAYGLTDLIRNNIPWQAVIKETRVDNLSIMTAGESCETLSANLKYSHIPNLLQEIQAHFDLIIFDTSPILRPNRNNVNIVSLTSVAGFFLLITKQSGTTKDHLKEVQSIIEAGNGKIDGIVLNEHTPVKRPAPYSE